MNNTNCLVKVSGNKFSVAFWCYRLQICTWEPLFTPYYTTLYHKYIRVFHRSTPLPSWNEVIRLYLTSLAVFLENPNKSLVSFKIHIKCHKADVAKNIRKEAWFPPWRVHILNSLLCAAEHDGAAREIPLANPWSGNTRWRLWYCLC